MANRRRRAKGRPQRPGRPPARRPGVADARANGRDNGDPELNGADVPDALAAAESALDEQQAELERSIVEFSSPEAGDPNGEAGDEAPPEPEDGVLEEDPFEEHLDEAPSSLEHATPDAEIADAQVAIGAQHAADFEDENADGLDDENADGLDDENADEFEDAGYDDDGQGQAVAESPRRTRRARGSADDAHARALAAHPETGVSEHRAGAITRLINFLQGSWRELQRVQWPDRRQVMQATGVVIGFVIVAGVFLGVSDWIAGKVMNLILYGSFNN